MKVRDLLKGLTYELVKGDVDKEIKGLSYDSRYTEKGDIFFCIKGYKTEGHIYAKDAIMKGATVIVCQKDIEITEDVTVIKVGETRKALAIVSATFYNKPSKKLKMIGITGTNGKTTTSLMIKRILEMEGFKVGLVGTISNHIGNSIIPSERTTPESLELHKLFREMIEKGCTHCVMEVSSHSLALDRVYGIKYDVSIFSNLTRDHLDFHKTFEEYYRAKLKLFQESSISIINIDDTYGQRLLKDIPSKIYTYSLKGGGDFSGSDEKLESTYSTFLLNGKEELKVSLPGEFNIYNALGAIGTARSLKVSLDAIRSGLSNINVPGRCEGVGEKYKLPFTIIIDYAHTPDGLQNIIDTLNGYKKGRVITIFGCGGDRDKVKRPQMGKIATSLSDYAIITSDNPRSEEPLEIIEDIVKGVKSLNYEIEVDRIDAIRKGITMAKENDIILIAGKGHETYQELKNGKIHFDEREIVDKILKDLEEE